MPQNYSTEVIDEIARIAREIGTKNGQDLLEAVESGLYPADKPFNLLIPIGNINPTNYSLLTRARLAFGTPTAGVVSNSAIVGMGVYTGGRSALQYGITTNKKAKACYAASTAFSASAIMSGGMAVMSRTCQISGTAAVSEMIGIAFLQLGNKAHVMALQMEGKPVPAKLRRFVDPTIRPVAFNSGGLGFVMPCPCPISSTFISSIPFEKIGKVVGFSLTAYGYYKIVVTGYSYSQKLISKFKEQRQKKLIKYRSTRLHRQAKFLVISFYHLPSVRRTLLIQRFATNNLVVHLG